MAEATAELGDTGHEVVAAQGRVRLDAADVDLFAPVHHHPVDHPRVMRGAVAAPATRIDRQDLYLVGELHEALRAREQLPLEVREDPVAVDVDPHAVDHARQLAYLLVRQELGLVADDVGDLAVGDVVVQVQHVPDLDRGGLQPQPGRDDPGAGPVLLRVEDAFSAPGVVLLESHGALTRVHRTGEVFQLRHASSSVGALGRGAARSVTEARGEHTSGGTRLSHPLGRCHPSMRMAHHASYRSSCVSRIAWVGALASGG